MYIRVDIFFLRFNQGPTCPCGSDSAGPDKTPVASSFPSPERMACMAVFGTQNRPTFFSDGSLLTPHSVCFDNPHTVRIPSSCMNLSLRPTAADWWWWGHTFFIPNGVEWCPRPGYIHTWHDDAWHTYTYTQTHTMPLLFPLTDGTIIYNNYHACAHAYAHRNLHYYIIR